MERQTRFNSLQLRMVRAARDEAATLVTKHYCIAPREWMQMPYEVRTLRSLGMSEVLDEALAQTLCYAINREAGSRATEQSDLYRICLQDHRILRCARATRVKLELLLLYVLTHELIHVVRFGCQLQSMDLPSDLRAGEEDQVERTTRLILAHSLPAFPVKFLEQVSEPELVRGHRKL